MISRKKLIKVKEKIIKEAKKATKIKKLLVKK